MMSEEVRGRVGEISEEGMTEEARAKAETEGTEATEESALTVATGIAATEERDPLGPHRR